jgi:hypothetical protein
MEIICLLNEGSKWNQAPAFAEPKKHISLVQKREYEIPDEAKELKEILNDCRYS